MADIKLVQDRGYGDCETCGYYDWSDTTLFVDGTEVKTWHYDGHLGGGVRFDDLDCIIEVLKSLGHTASEEVNHSD